MSSRLFRNSTSCQRRANPINGELIRYRTSVIRALDGDTKQDFERIRASLPEMQRRIDTALDRYAQVNSNTAPGKRNNVQELAELKEVGEKYIAASQQTIHLLHRQWEASSETERLRLRHEAEQNIAQNDGVKVIEVMLALDHLLEVVARIGDQVRQEANRLLQIATAITVGGSMGLTFVILIRSFATRSGSSNRIVQQRG